MNKILLDRLCKEYNFKWEVLGLYIKVTSKRGTYYIMNEDTEGRQIKLYHQNSIGSSGFHKHGKHNSLRCCMISIQSHDNIYNPGSRNNVYTRMDNIFNKLHAAS